ncbi:MAG TPA: type II CRISPR-associated endonuclease Cas1 [Planctomycetaceae bacterium]|nr:type II CRISPR-associated endonuclease Cas1 [Planctomycetaceae bacterium]
MRILDITDTGARLSLNLERLHIAAMHAAPVTVPLGELGVVVLGNPEVVITQPAIDGLMRAGAALIVCNQRRLPSGMMLPIEGHHLQTARMRAQSTAGLPLQKRLWQQLIRAKIGFQGTLLKEVTGADSGLLLMASRVRSGDPDNVEAQAARRYWGALPLTDGFRRNVEDRDLNQFLNYGYAILRGIVGRAICGAGLHPSLGLHHHNQFNAYCLADDLMEPFRPVVDRVIIKHRCEFEAKSTLDTESKRLLIEAILQTRAIGEVKRTLTDAVQLLATSLANVLVERTGKLVLPDRLEHAIDE